jgi:hypothetical protein
LEIVLGRKILGVEILKEAVRVGREKNDIAKTLARPGRVEVKLIAEALKLSQSI